MIHLSPKTKKVVDISIVSYGQKYGDNQIKRKTRLGYFLPSVGDHEIKEAIQSYNLTFEILASKSLTEGEAQLMRSPCKIKEGVVFEEAKECMRLRSKGITPEDIEEGHGLVPEDISSIEDIEEALSSPELFEPSDETLQEYMDRVDNARIEKDTS